MAALLISVILSLILLILLFQKIEIKFQIGKRATFTVSGTLVAVELSNFGKKRKPERKSPNPTVLFPIIAQVLRRSEVRVLALPEMDAQPNVLGVYKAIISLFLAYTDSITDKMILRTDEGSDAFFDVELEVGLWTLIFAFGAYKIKSVRRRRARV